MPGKTLKQLADQANELYDKCESHVVKASQATRNALNLARRCGEALNKAKPLVGHGKWMKWLKENFKASADTAEQYMLISREWETLKPVVAGRPDASIAFALNILRDRDGQSIPNQRTGTPAEYFDAKWDRREVVKLFRMTIEQWTDDEVQFLARYCNQVNSFTDIVLDHFDRLRAEMKPLLAPYLKAEAEAYKLRRAKQKEQGAKSIWEVRLDESASRELHERFTNDLIASLAKVKRLSLSQRYHVWQSLGKAIQAMPLTRRWVLRNKFDPGRWD